MSESLAHHRTDIRSKTALDRNATATPAELATGIETCDQAAGLSAIHDPGTGLVIWKRAFPLCLQRWIEQLDSACLPDLRVLVRPIDLRRAIEPKLDDCGTPAGDMRDLLIGDVVDLVTVFSKVAATDLVDVRLESISHDACWKFHRDCVEARFLTTYRGPGTEWVRPAQAEQALREQTDFNGPAEHVDVHDGVLFKGSCAGPGIGIVHRSPPIAGTGNTRLLLCLNKPSVTSPAPWSSAG
jgi:hypothetical protein